MECGQWGKGKELKPVEGPQEKKQWEELATFLAGLLIDIRLQMAICDQGSLGCNCEPDTDCLA